VLAIVISRNGGPEVLEPKEWPEPSPGDGQLLVAVEAAGVNFRDVYERRGGYGTPPPLVAGAEGAGSVVAAGAGVTEFAPGDRVAWTSATGSYAERVLVDAARAVQVPEALAPELAAAVLLQGMTAHYLATSTYPIRPGEDVLVHAAAGGVGLLLTQIAKMRGGRVIATASTEDKRRLARAYGADEAIGYEGFAEAVRTLTGGAGVHVVYDGIGRDTFDAGLSVLRPRGLMALYGAASGQPQALELNRLAAGGSLFVTRPMLPYYTASRDDLLARAEQVFEWVATGRLRVLIGGRYPLDAARRAHEDLESRRTQGKLILTPPGTPSDAL
jgi:NADPH:quinone reductase